MKKPSRKVFFASIIVLSIIVVTICFAIIYAVNSYAFCTEGESIQVRGMFQGYGSGSLKHWLGVQVNAYTFIIDNESFTIDENSITNYEWIIIGGCLLKEVNISLFDYTNFGHYYYEGIYVVIE